MAALDYGTLQQQVIARRFKQAQLPQAKQWIIDCYSRVWNATEDWRFLKSGIVSLTVAAGNPNPTLAADFGEAIEVFDDQGEPLAPMSEGEFFRYYRPAQVAVQKARPEAFTMSAEQMWLGPTPDAGYTFSYRYKRRLSTKTAGGVVQPGSFQSSGDLPFWPEAHHGVIVYGAAAIGHRGQADITGMLEDSDFASSLQAMLVELAPSDHGRRNMQYGRDPLGQATVLGRSLS